ncbi:accessory Sec system S-layer assembly protein [Alkalibacillus aidingensis]|uniref:accessory Sec system S-layer assembly protein n=1 Tax=Alkalibacillus aidingensis TaxID=2747607 RepID=UPI0016609494|nr:accessory Sec system S-layer assembly protein [Alkalibacillus aidingensis]
MKNPFRKRQKKSAKGKNMTVDANEVISDVGQDDTNQSIHPELSIHPQWTMDEEDFYVYQFQNNGLEPLKPNQLSLAGFELRINENNIVEVGAFVRHSLPKKISLEHTSLLLLDDDGKKLGRKSFDLSELGELPPNSSRPWLFTFSENDLFVPLTELPKEDFQLAFELKKEHRLDLEDSWEKSLAEQDKSKLEQLTKSLQPPKPGEVNFMGLEAKMKEDGSLQVTMLIRNGSQKTLNLEQVPLVVEDRHGEVIAKGGFKLADFQVQANTSKPWNFIFPKDLVLNPDADLSKWKAYPPRES